MFILIQYYSYILYTHIGGSVHLLGLLDRHGLDKEDCGLLVEQMLSVASRYKEKG